MIFLAARVVNSEERSESKVHKQKEWLRKVSNK